MARFVYVAKTSSGATVRASLEADDAMAAQRKLESQGVAIVELTEETASPGFFAGLVDAAKHLAIESAAQRDRHLGRPAFESASVPVTCGFCRASFAQRPGSSCTQCGGPLPAPPGPDRGESPPEPPRQLPARLTWNLFVTQNVIAWFGLGFAVVATFLGSVFYSVASTVFAGRDGSADVMTWVGPGVAGLLVAIGLAMFVSGLVTAARRRRALRSGVKVEGMIESVTLDRSTSFNGKSPYQVRYVFELEGTRHQGTKSTFDAQVRHYREAEPVWVVAVPDAPRVSAIWPPIA